MEDMVYTHRALTLAAGSATALFLPLGFPVALESSTLAPLPLGSAALSAVMVRDRCSSSACTDKVGATQQSCSCSRVPLPCSCPPRQIAQSRQLGEATHLAAFLVAFAAYADRVGLLDLQEGHQRGLGEPGNMQEMMQARSWGDMGGVHALCWLPPFPCRAPATWWPCHTPLDRGTRSCGSCTQDKDGA